MTIYGRKTKTQKLDFFQTIECPECKRAGSWRAFKSFKQFTINFIPLFKYSKKYYIETTCCGKRYEILPELGKQIENKEKTEISLAEIRGM